MSVNPGPVLTLARLAMQSEQYRTDMDFRDAVNAVVNNPVYDAAPELLEALKEVTDHLANVMGGPIMRGLGVKFENGIEGVPTIARARAAIAKSQVPTSTTLSR